MDSAQDSPPDPDAPGEPPFFRVPRALLDGGWLARLSDAQKDVVLGVLYFQSYGDSCWAGATKIARLVGRDVSTVKRALKAIGAMGLLTETEKGGGRDASRRRLAVPAGGGAVPPVAEPRPGCPAAPAPVAELRPPTRGTAPPPQGAHSSATHMTHIDETKNDTINNTGGAGDGDAEGLGGGGEAVRASAARDALRDAGVNEPTRSRLLAEVPGLTASVVRTLRGRLRAGEGAGLLVAAVRADAPDLVVREAHEVAERGRAFAAVAAREAAAGRIADPAARKRFTRETFYAAYRHVVDPAAERLVRAEGRPGLYAAARARAAQDGPPGDPVPVEDLPEPVLRVLAWERVAAHDVRERLLAEFGAHRARAAAAAAAGERDATDSAAGVSIGSSPSFVSAMAGAATFRPPGETATASAAQAGAAERVAGELGLSWSGRREPGGSGCSVPRVTHGENRPYAANAC